jgi:hypothetical protein
VTVPSNARKQLPFHYSTAEHAHETIHSDIAVAVSCSLKEQDSNLRAEKPLILIRKTALVPQDNNKYRPQLNIINVIFTAYYITNNHNVATYYA